MEFKGKYIFLTPILQMNLIFNDLEEQGTNFDSEILYTMPEESEEHEGTWLQWPHHYQYGKEYRNSLDPTWFIMTEALVNGESVHIVAYNQNEKERIITLSASKNLSLANIDFHLYETDDVWVRDNGPIFA